MLKRVIIFFPEQQSDHFPFRHSGTVTHWRNEWTPSIYCLSPVRSWAPASRLAGLITVLLNWVTHNDWSGAVVAVLKSGDSFMLQSVRKQSGRWSRAIVICIWNLIENLNIKWPNQHNRSHRRFVSDLSLLEFLVYFFNVLPRKKNPHRPHSSRGWQLTFSFWLC